MEIRKENRLFFLELSHFLQNYINSLLTKFLKGIITETDLFYKKENQREVIGVFHSSKKDMELLRKNTSDPALIAQLIPDNLTGEIFQESIVYIGNGYKAHFQLINPGLIEKKRYAIMKVSK